MIEDITEGPIKKLHPGQEYEFAKEVWQKLNGFIPSDDEIRDIVERHGQDYRGIFKEIFIGGTDDQADIALSEYLKKKEKGRYSTGLGSGHSGLQKQQSIWQEALSDKIFEHDGRPLQTPFKGVAEFVSEITKTAVQRKQLLDDKSIPAGIKDMFLSGMFEYSPADIKRIYDRFDEEIKAVSNITFKEYEADINRHSNEFEVNKKRLVEAYNNLRGTFNEYQNYISDWLKSNPEVAKQIFDNVGAVDEAEINEAVINEADKLLSNDRVYVQLRDKYRNALSERNRIASELSSVADKIRSKYKQALTSMPVRIVDNAFRSVFGEAYGIYNDINKDGRIAKQIKQIVDMSKEDPEGADYMLGLLNLNLASELKKRGKLTADIAQKIHDILYLKTNIYNALIDDDGVPSKLGMLGMVDRVIALAQKTKNEHREYAQKYLGSDLGIYASGDGIGPDKKYYDKASIYLAADKLEKTAKSLRDDIVSNWHDKSTLAKIWDGIRDAGLPIISAIIAIDRERGDANLTRAISKTGLIDLLRAKGHLDNVKAVAEAKKMDSDAYRWANMAMQSVNFMAEIAASSLLLGTPIPGDEVIAGGAAAARGARILNNILSSGKSFLKAAAIEIPSTALSPSTYKFIQERLKPEIIEQEGKVLVKEKDFTEALLKGFYESYAERVSERAGLLFDPFVKAFGNVLGRRALALFNEKKFGDLARVFSGNVSGAKKFFSIVNDYAKRIGLNNPFSEVAEEYFSFLIQNPVIGEQPWYYGILKENEAGGLEFDLKTFKDILVVTGIISGIPASVKAGGLGFKAVKDFYYRVSERDGFSELFIYNNNGDVVNVSLSGKAKDLIERLYNGQDIDIRDADISSDEYFAISLLKRIIDERPDIVSKRKVSNGYEFVISGDAKSASVAPDRAVVPVSKPVAPDDNPEPVVSFDGSDEKAFEDEKAPIIPVGDKTDDTVVDYGDKENVVTTEESRADDDIIIDVDLFNKILGIAKDFGINVDNNVVFYVGANHESFVYDFVNYIGKHSSFAFDAYKKFLSDIADIANDKTLSKNDRENKFNLARNSFVNDINSIFDDVVLINASDKIFLNPEYKTLINEFGFGLFGVPIIESGLNIKLRDVKDVTNGIGIYSAYHYTTGENIYEARNNKEVEALVLIDYYSKNKDLGTSEKKIIKEKLDSLIQSDLVSDDIKVKIKDLFNKINVIGPIGFLPQAYDEKNVANQILDIFDDIGLGDDDLPGGGTDTESQSDTVFTSKKFGSDEYESGVGHLYGAEDTIILPDGKTIIRIVYKVVPAAHLVQSHNEWTFTPLENYPVDEKGVNLNTRDYQSNIQNQSMVISMGNNFTHAAIQDVPIVNNRGVVYSGNNRIMSRKRAAVLNTDSEYLNYLYQNYAKYGFKKHDFAGINAPTLVGEILDLPKSQKEEIDLIRLFNVPTVKAKSTEERISEISRIIGHSAVSKIFDLVYLKKSVSEVVNDSDAYQKFLSILIEEKLLMPQEVEEYFNSGSRKVTDSGRNLFENILMGAVLEPDVIKYLYREGMGNVRNRIIENSLLMFRNQALGKDGLRSHFSNAIMLVYEAYSRNTHVATIFFTDDLFQQGKPKYDPADLAIALLYDGSGLKEFLTAYNKNIGITDIFGVNYTKEYFIDSVLKDNLDGYEKYKDSLWKRKPVQIQNIESIKKTEKSELEEAKKPDLVSKFNKFEFVGVVNGLFNKDIIWGEKHVGFSDGAGLIKYSTYSGKPLQGAIILRNFEDNKYALLSFEEYLIVGDKNAAAGLEKIENYDYKLGEEELKQRDKEAFIWTSLPDDIKKAIILEAVLNKGYYKFSSGENVPIKPDLQRFLKDTYFARISEINSSDFNNVRNYLKRKFDLDVKQSKPPMQMFVHEVNRVILNLSDSLNQTGIRKDNKDEIFKLFDEILLDVYGINPKDRASFWSINNWPNAIKVVGSEDIRQKIVHNTVDEEYNYRPSEKAKRKPSAKKSAEYKEDNVSQEASVGQEEEKISKRPKAKKKSAKKEKSQDKKKKGRRVSVPKAKGRSKDLDEDENFEPDDIDDSFYTGDVYGLEDDDDVEFFVSQLPYTTLEDEKLFGRIIRRLNRRFNANIIYSSEELLKAVSRSKYGKIIRGGGRILGAYLGNNTIYISPVAMTAKVAIHEFAHLLMAIDKKFTDNAIAILKQSQKAFKRFEELKKRYPYSLMDDDYVWREVLAEAISEKGHTYVSYSLWDEFIYLIKDLISKIANALGIQISTDSKLDVIFRDALRKLGVGRIRYPVFMLRVGNMDLHVADVEFYADRGVYHDYIEPDDSAKDDSYARRRGYVPYKELPTWAKKIIDAGFIPERADAKDFAFAYGANGIILQYYAPMDFVDNILTKEEIDKLIGKDITKFDDIPQTAVRLILKRVVGEKGIVNNEQLRERILNSLVSEYVSFTEQFDSIDDIKNDNSGYVTIFDGNRPVDYRIVDFQNQANRNRANDILRKVWLAFSGDILRLTLKEAGLNNEDIAILKGLLNYTNLISEDTRNKIITNSELIKQAIERFKNSGQDTFDDDVDVLSRLTGLSRRVLKYNSSNDVPVYENSTASEVNRFISIIRKAEASGAKTFDDVMRFIHNSISSKVQDPTGMLASISGVIADAYLYYVNNFGSNLNSLPLSEILKTIKHATYIERSSEGRVSEQSDVTISVESGSGRVVQPTGQGSGVGEGEGDVASGAATDGGGQVPGGSGSSTEVQPGGRADGDTGSVDGGGGSSGVQPRGATTDGRRGEMASGDAEKAKERGSSGLAKTDLKKLQKEKNKINTGKALGDPDAVKSEILFITPEQAIDVGLIEEALFVNNRKAILVTNPTGSGKTFTALSVIRRLLYRKPDAKILVFAPSQDILNKYIYENDLFGLDINISKFNKSQGLQTGVNLITYAGLTTNIEIADTTPDLVVFDESENILQNRTGTETKRLNLIRKLLRHRDFVDLQLRADDIQKISDLERAIKSLKSEYNKLVKSGDPSAVLVEAQIAALTKRLIRVKQEAELAAKHDIETKFSNIKAIFMSATAIPYHASIEYLEGFVFSLPKDLGVSREEALRKFLKNRFGIVIEGGEVIRKKTTGLADEEKAFVQELIDSGALITRVNVLDVDFSRHFYRPSPAVTTEFVGFDLTLVDELFDDLHSAFVAAGLKDIGATIIRSSYSFKDWVALLEIYKLQSLVPKIKEFVEDGYNVILFHNYNIGPKIGFGEFNKDKILRIAKSKAPLAFEIIDDMLSRPKYAVLRAFEPRPIAEVLKQYFPNALLYNGTVPAKKRSENKQIFNSNKGQIILVQKDAKAGIDLHDKTGQVPRVTIFLGMPTSANDMIQAEGRTLRYGGKSNAVYIYPVTGTKVEHALFARAIDRTISAENLSQGNNARALDRSLKRGLLRPTNVLENMGVGGKAADDMMAKMSAMQMAIDDMTLGIGGAQEFDGYMVPHAPVNAVIAKFVGATPGHKVIEISGGGAALRFLEYGTRHALAETINGYSSIGVLAPLAASKVYNNFSEITENYKYNTAILYSDANDNLLVRLDNVKKIIVPGSGRILMHVPRSLFGRVIGFSDANPETAITGAIAIPSELSALGEEGIIVSLELFSSKSIADNIRASLYVGGAPVINESIVIEHVKNGGQLNKTIELLDKALFVSILGDDIARSGFGNVGNASNILKSSGKPGISWNLNVKRVSDNVLAYQAQFKASSKGLAEDIISLARRYANDIVDLGDGVYNLIFYNRDEFDKFVYLHSGKIGMGRFKTAGAYYIHELVNSDLFSDDSIVNLSASISRAIDYIYSRNRNIKREVISSAFATFERDVVQAAKVLSGVLSGDDVVNMAVRAINNTTVKYQFRKFRKTHVGRLISRLALSKGGLRRLSDVISNITGAKVYFTSNAQLIDVTSFILRNYFAHIGAVSSGEDAELTIKQIYDNYISEKEAENIFLSDTDRETIYNIVYKTVYEIILNRELPFVQEIGVFLGNRNVILINLDKYSADTIFHEFIHSIFYNFRDSYLSAIAALSRRRSKNVAMNLQKLMSVYTPDVLFEEAIVDFLTEKASDAFNRVLNEKKATRGIVNAILTKFGLLESDADRTIVDVINEIGRAIKAGEDISDTLAEFDFYHDNKLAVSAFLNKAYRYYRKARDMMAEGADHDDILYTTGWEVHPDKLVPSYIMLFGLPFSEEDYRPFRADNAEDDFANNFRTIIDTIKYSKDVPINKRRDEFIRYELESALRDELFNEIGKNGGSGSSDDYQAGSPASELYSGRTDSRTTYARLLDAALRGRIPNINVNQYKNLVYDVKSVRGHEDVAKEVFGYLLQQAFKAETEGDKAEDIKIENIDKAKEFIIAVREFLNNGKIRDIDDSSLNIIKDIIRVLTLKFIYGKILSGPVAANISSSDRLYFEKFATDFYDELSVRQTQRGQEVKIIGEAVKDIINSDIISLVKGLVSRIEEIIRRLGSLVIRAEDIENIVSVSLDSLIDTITTLISELTGKVSDDEIARIRADIESIISSAETMEDAAKAIKDYIQSLGIHGGSVSDDITKAFDNFKKYIKDLIIKALKKKGVKTDGIEKDIDDIIEGSLPGIIDGISGIVGEYAAGVFYGRLRRMARRLEELLTEYLAAEDLFMLDGSSENYAKMMEKRLAIERLISDTNALLSNYHVPAFIKYIDLIRPALFTITSTTMSLVNNMLMAFVRAAELMVFILSSLIGASNRAALLKQGALFGADLKAVGYYFYSIPNVLKSVMLTGVGSGGISEKISLEISAERRSTAPLLHFRIARDRFEDLVTHWSKADTITKLREILDIGSDIIVGALSVVPTLMARPLQAADEIFKYWHRLNIMSALSAKNDVPYYDIISRKAAEYYVSERIAQRMLYQQDNVVTNTLDWLSKSAKSRLQEAIDQKIDISSGFVEKALTGERKRALSAWLSYGVVEYLKMVLVAFARFPINYALEIIHLAVPAISLASVGYHISMYRNARSMSDKDFHRYMASSYALKLLLSFAGMAIAMKLIEAGLINSGYDDDDEDKSLQKGFSLAYDIIRMNESPEAEYLAEGEIKLGEHRVSLMSVWAPYVSMFIWAGILNKINKKRAELGLPPYNSTDILPSIAKEFFGVSVFYDNKGFNTLFDIVMSNTFFQQWSNYYKLFTMQEGAGAKTLADLIYFSAAPLQPRVTISAQRYIMRDELGTQRILKKDNFKDEFIVRLANNAPFLSMDIIKSLPERFNIWGEKIQRKEPGESDFYAYFIDPVRYRRVSPKTIDEWKYVIAAVYNKYKDDRLIPPTITRKMTRGLTPYQKAILFNEYNYIFGNYFKNYFTDVYNSNYRGRVEAILSDPAEADRFANDVEQAYNYAHLSAENLIINLYLFNFADR